MNQQSREPKFLAVDDMRPLNSKVLIPAMLVFLGILSATSPTTKPLGVALSGLLILMGVMLFVVVGLVKPTEECLFYKRFSEWRRIEYNDIVKCGRSFFPLFWGLHYLKLRNSGRLYFVQYHPVRPLSQSQYELGKEMIDYIRARIGGKPPPSQVSPGMEISNLPTGSPQLGLKACAISALLSALTVLFLRVLLSWPGPSFPPKIVPGQGIAYRILIYISLFCARLVDTPYNAVAILGLLVGISLLRFRRHAAFLSLALGAIVGDIVARWFD
jgi:hypothetical protein